VYDICCSYGIHAHEVYKSVWIVVDVLNKAFTLEYPADEVQQRAIAAKFQEKSGANFGSCAGAIDGFLVWIHKPTPEDCRQAETENGVFYCGRKKKFGLNCQLVADAD
jgi:hypothetical protein